MEKNIRQITAVLVICGILIATSMFLYSSYATASGNAKLPKSNILSPNNIDQINGVNLHIDYFYFDGTGSGGWGWFGGTIQSICPVTCPLYVNLNTTFNVTLNITNEDSGASHHAQALTISAPFYIVSSSPSLPSYASVTTWSASQTISYSIELRSPGISGVYLIDFYLYTTP